MYWAYTASFLVVAGERVNGQLEGSSVGRDRGCPMPAPTGSSWLQQPHCRAQLGPEAKVVAPRRKRA